MNKQLKVLTLIAALGISGAANAALQSRLGGLAVYDTDLNITWLADANANGLMDWATANAWASGLTVGGFSGWRLPTTLQPDVSCRDQWSGGAYGTQSGGYNCTGSEMGHLFYNELGGAAGSSILTTHNANLALFQNVHSGYYWSGSEYAPDTGGAWGFDTYDGYQYASNKNANLFAMAVRPGDVAAVPVPAAAWLLGSGLLGLIGVARRKAHDMTTN